MKVQKRSIIILICAAVVLMGSLWAALTFTTPKPEDEGRKTYTLIGRTDTDLETAAVSNAYGGYTVYKSGGDYMWQVEGNELLPQQKSRYYSFAKYCTALSASYRLETNELDKYGLDRPAAVVDIAYSDGESLTVTVGDRLRDESYQYFMLSNEPGVVYAGNSVQFDFMTGDSIMLVDTLLAPHAPGKYTNDSGDKADGVIVEQGGQTFRYDTLPETARDGYGNSYINVQSEPAGSWSSYILPDTYSAYFGRVMELGAYDAVAVIDSESELKTYGLDKPDTVLTIIYGGEQTRISLVKDENDKDYYAFKAGTNVVWHVVERIVTWTEIERNTLITRYFASPLMSETTSVSLVVYDESAQFEIDENGTALWTGGTTTGRPDGALSKESWDGFYKLCASANSDTVSESSSASDETVVMLTFTGGYGEVELELKRAGSRQLAVWVNGEFTGYSVRETFAGRLEQSLQALAADENISWTW